jgi:hypothetical protein
MQQKDHSTFVLESTGREFYAHAGLLSVSVDDGETDIYYGYDGGLSTSDFTAEEKREVADYVIALWQRWAAGG